MSKPNTKTWSTLITTGYLVLSLKTLNWFRMFYAFQNHILKQLLLSAICCLVLASKAAVAVVIFTSSSADTYYLSTEITLVAALQPLQASACCYRTAWLSCICWAENACLGEVYCQGIFGSGRPSSFLTVLRCFKMSLLFF